MKLGNVIKKQEHKTKDEKNKNKAINAQSNILKYGKNN